jgi:hypothetical protein
MVTALAPALAICTPIVALALTRTLPKFSEAGLSVSVGAVATPMSETNSREVLEFEEISSAPTRVPGPVPACDEFCGVNATVTPQLAPATNIEQLLVGVKSGDVWSPRIVSVVLPVLLSVMLCAADTPPTAVLAKVSEPSDVVSAASGAAFDGDDTVTGVELPLKSIRSGLDAASLSISRVPVSAVDGGGELPVATWLIGV